MPSKLPKPQYALGDYLDEMLHQATGEKSRLPALGRPAKLLLPAELLAPETAVPELSEPEPAAAVALEQSVEALPQAAEIAEPPEPRARAVELEYPLQCLMFRVGGHLLSVPLVQLGSVVNWSDTLTRLPQSPPWLLGLIKVRDVNLRVVDSSCLLQMATPGEINPEHLLVLDDSGWAITCDHLEQVVNVEYEDVQWKTDSGGGMILGTIRESLATLLSPPGIAAELNARGEPAVAE